MPHTVTAGDFCRTCRGSQVPDLPVGPRRKHPWTAEEDQRLRELASTHAIDALARHLNRTHDSIVYRLMRLRISAVHPRRVVGGMTVEDVAVAFGVPVHTVRNWACVGRLRPVQKARRPGDPISFDGDALIDFLECGGALLALHPRGEWAGIIADIRADLCRRWITRHDLEQALAIHSGAITRWTRDLGFPPPVAVLHHHTLYYDRAQVAAWLDRNPGRLGRWTPAARRLLAMDDA